MKIEKIYPAGWKIITDNDTYYIGEFGKFGCYCNEGVVYKDENAFKTGEGVCYISEYGFEEDNLLDDNIKEVVTKEVGNIGYIAISGYTRADLIALCNGDEDIAEDLFDHLDWMFPETLWGEWCDEEEMEELKK